MIIPVERMKEIGLLMETEIRNPETQGETEILRQFAHLSVQEFLAMCGLLKKGPEKVRETVSTFSKSEQFNMALLFLYGLAFDIGSETVKSLAPTETMLEHKKALKDTLKYCIAVSETWIVFPRLRKTKYIIIE